MERDGRKELLLLRVPPAFAVHIRETAKKEHRSISGELMHRLERDMVREFGGAGDGERSTQ
jgi:hypothetical protein